MFGVVQGAWIQSYYMRHSISHEQEAEKATLARWPKSADGSTDARQLLCRVQSNMVWHHANNTVANMLICASSLRVFQRDLVFLSAQSMQDPREILWDARGQRTWLSGQYGSALTIDPVYDASWIHFHTNANVVKNNTDYSVEKTNDRKNTALILETTSAI